MTLISLAIVVAFVTQLGRHARPVRGRDLVGARDADHDHAPRPLARDALDRPGARRPDGARRAAARHGRAGHRRRHRGRCRSPRSRSATSCSSGPGARVPADGVVVEGSADVDESMITGESRAVAKEPGDTVVAGTVAAGGSLRVRVTASATTPRCRGSCAWSRPPRRRRRAPRRWPTGRRPSCSTSPSAPASSRSSSGGSQGDPEGALVRTATVLVIACPHALGLAIPLVIAISTSLGARNGLLVKDRLALERARDARRRHLRQDRAR